jgi:cytochrome c5
MQPAPKPAALAPTLAPTRAAAVTPSDAAPALPAARQVPATRATAMRNQHGAFRPNICTRSCSSCHHIGLLKSWNP